MGTCVSLTRGSAPSPSYCTFLNIGHIWQFPGCNHCHRCVDRFHGLQVIPPVLMLQLHRFQQQKGATIKNRGKVRLDNVIRVPVFQGRGGSMVHHVQYTLAAFIEHHGNTPISGHYTVTLAQEKFWNCDDGRIAQARHVLKDQQLRDCYALFYRIQPDFGLER